MVLDLRDKRAGITSLNIRSRDKNGDESANSLAQF